MRLQPPAEHPHGLPGRGSSTPSSPPTGRSIFNFHGYPWLIHRLDLPPHRPRQPPRARLSSEEGTTTTPFDMAMLNGIDRFHLVIDVIDRVEDLGVRFAGSGARR